jgi:predicted metal-dependent phosphoesterase TrpH
MFADLHMHSTASDGTTTPAGLVSLAREAGVTLMALTDHDTVGGCREAALAARESGIAFLSGVEVTAEGGSGRADILGLGIRRDDPTLTSTLERVMEARRTRNVRIVARLNELGVDITLEQIISFAPPGANVGRPHFAAALVACGAVPDKQAAFDVYLADGAKAFVGRDSLTPAEAIALIHTAGGLAFLAHPMLVRLKDHETVESRVRKLKDEGIDGIEVWYSSHSPVQEEKLARIASSLDLLVTGGSDFHGDNKPHLRLGGVRDGRPLERSLIPETLAQRVDTA